MDVNRFSKSFNRIVDNVNTVIHGKDDVVRLSLVAILAGGHILFEDVPGVGKSMLARALGMTMRADMNRIQCTPDMLPGDITGSSVIDTKTMEFVFRPGPAFTNVLLVDEINRATPKTQSALLESMGEQRVSVDGVTHELPKPFLVLATQNPVELAGTFPLPEAQLDRFMFRLSMGYPDLESERLVVLGNATKLQVDDLEPVVSTKEVIEMMGAAAEVEVVPSVLTYILELTHATRDDAACTLGAGPRASIVLYKAAKVLAGADGRNRVYPEDVKAILRPVLGHRMMLTPDAVLRGETVDDVLDRAVNRVKPPLGIAGASDGSTAGEPAMETAAPTNGSTVRSAPRSKTRSRRREAATRR